MRGNKGNNAKTTVLGIAALFTAVFIFAAAMKTVSWTIRRANAEHVQPLSEVAADLGGNADFGGCTPEGEVDFFCRQGDLVVHVAPGVEYFTVTDESLSQDDPNRTTRISLQGAGDSDPWVTFTEGERDALIPKSNYDAICGALKTNAPEMEKRKSWNAYWEEIKSQYGTDSKPDCYPWEFMDPPSRRATGASE